MGRSRSGSEISFFNMLVRPQVAFRAMILEERDRLAISGMVVAGIVCVVAWAELFGLGRHYSTGRILSGALLIGPFVGCAGQMLTALAGMWMGNLLDRRHRAEWKLHVEIPPFPLKNLVWKRVLGAEGIRRMWSLPILGPCLRAWSWLLAALRLLRQSTTGGSVGYWKGLGLQNQAARLFLPAGIAAWCAVNFLGMDGFGADGTAAGSQWLLSLMLLLSFAAYLWLWTQALRVAYHLPLGKSLVAAFCSTGLGMGVVGLLLKFLAGVHLT